MLRCVVGQSKMRNNTWLKEDAARRVVVSRELMQTKEGRSLWGAAGQGATGAGMEAGGMAGSKGGRWHG